MNPSYQKYAAQGIAVFPCNRNKTPATGSGFHDASRDPEELKKLFHKDEFLVGLPTGNVNGIVVIDFDTYKSGMNFDELKELVESETGKKFPETLCVQTQSGGIHLYYKLEVPTETRASTRFINKNWPIDIRSNGGYVCAPADDGLYEPLDVDEDQYWTDIRSLCATLPEWIENWTKIKESEPVREIETLPESEIIEIRSALAFMDSDNYDEWIRVGQALRSTNSPSGFYLWDEWSRKSSKYNPEVMQSKWDSFKGVRDVTIATIFHYAKGNGWVTTYKNSSPVPIALINIDEIDEKRNHEKAPFPQHLLNPPGLVGEIVQHINKFSKKKQPILALGASLAACGAIMGQRFQTDQGLRTNVYILGVGESGCGKEAARSAIKRLFENSDIGELAGTEDLASDAAILTALDENPSQVFLIDEIGRFFKTTNQSSSKNSHLYNIISLLLKLYSSANQEFRGKSYADSVKKKVIHSPNLCIYGTTVPRSLFEGLLVENITDGFLSRFLIFESEDQDPAPEGRRKFATEKTDPDLILKVKEIFGTERNIIDKGNLAKREIVNPRIVQFTDDAENMAIEYEQYIHEKRKKLREQEEIDTIYNRAPSFAEQIALILAVGRNHSSPIIEEDDFQYAMELVDYLTDRLWFIARHHISSNDQEANFKKVLNMIRTYGKRGMTKSQFTRKTQFLKKYDREDILDNLAESGQIKLATNESGKTIIYPIKEEGYE